MVLFATVPHMQKVMSTRVEYVYAASLTIAEDAARKSGWRPSGRAAWLKADGTTVHFICFEEQLTALPRASKVHRVR